MSFSIRLNPEEEKLFKSYADLHGYSLGEAFKKALLEKIEDEYDAAVADMAYEEYLKDPVTYSMEEAKEMLEL
ncbi:MAG: type II toxin-antitoxin system RelB family antitoxin [Beduini sp.]